MKVLELKCVKYAGNTVTVNQNGGFAFFLSKYPSYNFLLCDFKLNFRSFEIPSRHLFLDSPNRF